MTDSNSLTASMVVATRKSKKRETWITSVSP